MRIVLDLQAAQSCSKTTAIGENILLLAEAIILQAPEHEIILALNNMFPDTIESIRDRFDAILPQKNIRVWEAVAPVNFLNDANKGRRKAAQIIYESFLINLQPDFILIGNLFEGLMDDAVTSIGTFCSSIPAGVLLHDYNSLVFHSNTTVNINADLWYENKIAQLQRAECIIAWSKEVQEKAKTKYGFNDNNCKVLSESGKNNLIDWQASAMELLDFIQSYVGLDKQENTFTKRPRLAYFSPFPPLKSGVSFYSAELIRELARFYDIDVIVQQENIDDPWINANCPIHSIDWFMSHYQEFDRILYQMGNSLFHDYIYRTAMQIPGVVVMHDFIIFELMMNLRSSDASNRDMLGENLYLSHGYRVTSEWFRTKNLAEFAGKYAVNFPLLQASLSVIGHSNYLRNLAIESYGPQLADKIDVIPLLRTAPVEMDRSQARADLGIGADDFVVCCFGILTQLKLNHIIIKAWMESQLHKDVHCRMIFVGKVDNLDSYCEMKELLFDTEVNNSITITGWIDTPTYQNYLAAADLAVQLRANSRGETSASLLDCLNYGIPTIINDSNLLSEFPDNCVYAVSDQCHEYELIEALETLKLNPKLRAQLSKNGKELVRTKHNSLFCAQLYHQVIEKAYKQQVVMTQLCKTISSIDGLDYNDATNLALAAAINRSLPPRITKRQLLVDVTNIMVWNWKQGIGRASIRILNELLEHPFPGFVVEPVYINSHNQFCYARQFTCDYLGFGNELSMPDEMISFEAGDILFGLTTSFQSALPQAEFYKTLRNYGVKVKFIVHDLLPVLMPHYFYQEVVTAYQQWLHTVVQTDGAFCISKAVAGDLLQWCSLNPQLVSSRFKVDWFHLGADIVLPNEIPALPSPTEQNILNALASKISFISVSTIEPRKGHEQTLKAFEKLWAQGLDVNLVFVGQSGWLIDDFIAYMRTHQELNKRFFWLEGIDDAYLAQVYACCNCLIFASLGEGFGLAIIEAAKYGLSIIARDLPIFREVSQNHALFFKGTEPSLLADTVQHWLNLYQENQHPDSKNMPWLTWRESSDRLKELLDA